MSESIQASTCYIEGLSTKRLVEFHVPPTEYYTAIHKLSEYGKVERHIFSENKNGPILLVFKEIHMFGGRKVRNDNIRGFMAIRDSVDFMTSEGGNTEFIYEGHFSGNSPEEFQKHLAESYYKISTEALEEYYKDSIDTCGIDLKMDELEKVIAGFSRLKTRHDLREYDRKVAITPRNKLWLDNIIKILEQNKDKRGIYARNIVPLFAGGDHVNDLILQARKRGFQGVITFESHNYADVLKKINSSR